MPKLALALLLLIASACATNTPLTQPTAQPSPITKATVAAPLPPTIAPPTWVPTQTPTNPPTAPTDVLTVPTNAPAAPLTENRITLKEFDVPAGAHPHDVAPAADGGIWYTAQNQGALGYLDVNTGATRQIPLGRGSAPHGVILGPDGAPWITDSGLNAIVRVEPSNNQVEIFPLPETHRGANLNTAVFDKNGVLWFTGQRGVYGRLVARGGKVEAWNAPRGAGPYGITATPDGKVYYASLAGNHIARIDPATGQATVIEPPTKGQGARRIWSDSRGRVWVSEWNAGQIGMYDPAANVWREWKLPGTRPQAYAIYVDEQDQIWVSDFGSNSLVRFDPQTEKFDVYALPSAGAAVRQIHGRPGQVWGAESGVDKIIRLHRE